MKKWTGVEIYHIICRFPNATSLEKELDNEEHAEFLKIYNQFANLTTKRVNIVDLPKRKGPKVRTKKVDKEYKTNLPSTNSNQEIEELIQNRFDLLTLDVATK